MTAATHPAQPQEARRAMTRPRTPQARDLPLPEALERLTDRATRTPDAYPHVRRHLLALAARARRTQTGQALQADLIRIRTVMAHARARHAAWLAAERAARAALPTHGAAARAAALTTAACTSSTTRQLTATKRRLVQLMWNARQAGDHHTRAEIRRTYDRVTARIAREKRTLTPEDILARQHVRETPPLQLTREAAQRAQQEARRPELDAAAQQRTLARAAQNALAHAIWSTYTGDRTWEAIPTRPTTLQAHAPREEPSSSATGPARLTIRVPATPTTPAVTLHLYRSDYQALLDLWGYDHTDRALRAAHDLRSNLTPTAAIDAALELMLAAARHPNLARAWRSYITSPRLGDIYRWHEASQTLQLSTNRNGDLREAVEQLYRACRLTPSE